MIPEPSPGWHQDSAERDLCQETGGGGGTHFKLVISSREQRLLMQGRLLQRD